MPKQKFAANIAKGMKSAEQLLRKFADQVQIGFKDAQERPIGHILRQLQDNER